MAARATPGPCSEQEEEDELSSMKAIVMRYRQRMRAAALEAAANAKHCRLSSASGVIRLSPLWHWFTGTL